MKFLNKNRVMSRVMIKRFFLINVMGLAVIQGISAQVLFTDEKASLQENALDEQPLLFASLISEVAEEEGEEAFKITLHPHSESFDNNLSQLKFDVKVASQSASRQSRSLQRAMSYTVKGKTYRTLSNSEGFEQVGDASWYGPGFHGRKTASGEVYDMNELTAAHKELPLGTEVEVTNLTTGKSIVVRINDRGPFHGDRVLDLSRAAAKELGVIKQGTAEVSIRALR